jgi:anti-anti-sigma factor
MDDVSDDTTGLQVEVPVGGASVVRVSGQIDIETAGTLRGAVEQLLASGPPPTIEFDFGAVTFMDSSGLAVLIDAENRGVVVTVTQATSSVALTIRATGLEHLLAPGS